MSADTADFPLHSVGFRVLSECAVVHVTGEDARTWLNGQITNDVRSTREGEAVYALVLLPKGKVLADVHAVDRGREGFFLVLPSEVVERVLEQFEKYVIMEDVTLSRADHLAVITAQGPKAALATEGLAVRFPSVRIEAGGYDLIVPRDVLEATRSTLLARTRELGGGEMDSDSWELARLRSGRPAFGVDFGDSTYPQEAGLASSAVSFQKGCYLGQEVVCMLENRGQLTRRLVHVFGNGLAAGSELRDEAGASVGKVTSATSDPRSGGDVGLAMVKRAALSAQLSNESGGVEVRASLGL